MGEHETCDVVLPENLIQATDTNCTVKCYGAELIGCRVKIWWAQEKMFSRGIIKYFYSDERMHMVDYDIGVKELLDLSEERWQLEEQETDSGPGASNTMVKNVGISSSNNSKRKHVEAACQDVMTEKDQKKVIEKELISHEDQAICHKTAAADSEIFCQSSEQPKRQKTLADPPRSSVQDGNPDACTELVDVSGYVVKATFAPILGSIFSKYGDIASSCPFKHHNIRSLLLEIVCNVVRKLQIAESGVSTYEAKEMISEISDAEEAKLDVSWLKKFLEEEIARGKKSTELMKLRANSKLIAEAARKDMEDRRMEVMAAKKQFMEAKNRWKALEHVKAKIENDVVDLLAPEQAWRRRVDELL